MIKVEGLYHSYKKDNNWAVRNIEFNVNKGEIFGFLGPSGAGKSTTQNILTGLIPLQKGKVEVDGYDISKVDKKRFNRIGVSFEQSNLYSSLSAIDNLKYYGKLFDTNTRDEKKLIDMVGLQGKYRDKVSTFSKGMKHRLTFVRSLINSPKMWFLDEPTTGLDPSIAADIKNIIKKERDNGITTFLTTHNMYIADELCDRVAFIVDGEIKLIDSPKNLKLKYKKNYIFVEYYKNNLLISEDIDINGEKEKHKLIDIINSYDIVSMHTKEATLEEIFIMITGKGLTHNETS